MEQIRCAKQTNRSIDSLTGCRMIIYKMWISDHSTVSLSAEQTIPLYTYALVILDAPNGWYLNQPWKKSINPPLQNPSPLTLRVVSCSDVMQSLVPTETRQSCVELGTRQSWEEFQTFQQSCLLPGIAFPTRGTLKSLKLRDFYVHDILQPVASRDFSCAINDISHLFTLYAAHRLFMQREGQQRVPKSTCW